MNSELTEKIKSYLSKYKEVLEVIDLKNSKQDIKNIDEIITKLQELSNGEFKYSSNPSDTSLVSRKENKITFEEMLRLLKINKLGKVKGLKINYKDFISLEEIIRFFESQKKDEVLKKTTALDLNLFYGRLSGNEKEYRKKKDELYDMITGYIKANRQGEAFSKWVRE